MQLGKLIGIIGIILISVFLVVAARNIFFNSQITGNTIKEVDAGSNSGEQVVDLSVKDYNYYPNVINLKYNVPAKIVVDTSRVKGCLQSIVIPDFGIKKFVRGNDNVIEFIPDKGATIETI